MAQINSPEVKSRKTANGMFTYKPVRGFAGSDNFTYMVTNGSQTSSPALVLLYVEEGACPAVSLYGEGSRQVRVLRRWRDEVLETSAAGRLVVQTYYRAAPNVQSLLNRHSFLHWAAQAAIDSVLPVIERRLE